MRQRWEHVFGAVGLVLLLIGSYQGLFVAPPDRFMGEVSRILYVHVPAAWSAMLCFSFAGLVAGVSFVQWLRDKPWDFDAWLEAGVESGVVMGGLLLVLGSIWARPTWGVWWDWDPRLTTAAIMEVSFIGIMALRAFVDEPQQRSLWSVVATLLAYIDVPIVYFSVRWWRTMHQSQSGSENMDPAMRIPLLVNALAFTLISVWFIVQRWRLGKLHQQAELNDPDDDQPAGLGGRMAGAQS